MSGTSASSSPRLLWAVRKWAVDIFGVADVDEMAKTTKANTMAGVADRITCPTLVLDGENDQFFKGQPQRLFDALTCQKELIFFREDGGEGEHCHEGALSLWHQRAFDWLDAVLARCPPSATSIVSISSDLSCAGSDSWIRSGGGWRALEAR